MKKFTILFVWILFGIGAAIAQNSPKTYEYKNGSWFNGQGFSEGRWYVVNGQFTQKTPAKIDSVIDLEGRWVIPPMGDAFCSSLADNPSFSYTAGACIGEGIFYLQVLSNSQEGRKNAASVVNKAKGPDAIFANGGITCTLGVPFVQYEAPAQNIRNQQMVAARYEQLKLTRKMHGDGYWFVDTKEDLDKNWPGVLQQKPGVISIYLLDVANSGGKEGKGLTAEMAKLVVKNAHKANLRVWAHVETAEDVRLGMKLGVDGFANVPGANWDGVSDKSIYELPELDLKKIAKKGTPMIATFSHAQSTGANPTVQNYQAQLLQKLVANGVNVVIGSNDPQRTIRTELNYWFQFNNLEYAQALRILCQNTPAAIYPNRKIGRIQEGYEASFVVLSDTPEQNLLKVRAISFMVKNGYVFSPATK